MIRNALAVLSLLALLAGCAARRQPTKPAPKQHFGALGRSRTGCNFEALDGKPVSIVVLFLVPQGQFQKHLQTLAGIAKLLNKADFRQALEQAPDPATMLKIIKDSGGKK